MLATTITTERLVLRSPTLDDAEAFFDSYTSDPEVTRYLSWRTHASVEESREYLAGIPDRVVAKGETERAICVGGADSPCGMITTWKSDFRVGVGYVLARSEWGKGIMTEALRAVLDLAWRDQSVWRVSAYCHPDNVGSARVMEKCGMTLEGRTRRTFVLPQLGEDPRDALLYAMTRDDLG
ncbi:MAG: GNAT family N-acetyltransferase [Lacipirellulaceae bacterium]